MLKINLKKKFHKYFYDDLNLNRNKNNVNSLIDYLKIKNNKMFLNDKKMGFSV